MSVAEPKVCEQHRDSIEKLKKNIEQIIKGKTQEIELLITALIASESVLIQDVPGVGKTTLARALAASLEMDFQRVQCTPDLMPGDIFGVSVFHPNTGEFQFRKGAVFTNILLVDEINRSSPRTQSALLEAMAERQVSVEGNSFRLEPPFMVIATQNPAGSHGTFPLPASQLDRFAMRFSMDYPDRDAELEVLYQQSQDLSLDELPQVLSLEDVLELQRLRTKIKFDRSLGEYLLEILHRTRNHPEIQLGCSPRAGVTWFKCAQALAVVRGRDFVLPDDIQALATVVLPHRMVAANRNRQGTQLGAVALIEEIVAEVDVPV